MTPLPRLTPAQTVALMYRELETEFPYAVFKIRTSYNTGAVVAAVSWFDGPVVDNVLHVLARYRPSHPGLVEGSTRKGPLQLDGTPHASSIDVIICQRDCSATRRARALKIAAEFYTGDADLMELLVFKMCVGENMHEAAARLGLRAKT